MRIFAMYLIDYKRVKNIKQQIQKDVPFRKKNGKICHFDSKQGSEDENYQIYER